MTDPAYRRNMERRRRGGVVQGELGEPG